MNLDWRKPDFSFLGVELPLPSSESLRESLLLLMRKKFLIRCDTWLLDPLTCLFVDRDAPEKVRLSVFSVMLVCVDAEELKSCVIVVTPDGGCCCCWRRGEERHTVVEGEEKAAGELARVW
jgi:hypothetical protein